MSGLEPAKNRLPNLTPLDDRLALRPRGGLDNVLSGSLGRLGQSFFQARSRKRSGACARAEASCRFAPRRAFSLALASWLVRESGRSEAAPLGRMGHWIPPTRTNQLASATEDPRRPTYHPQDGTRSDYSSATRNLSRYQEFARSVKVCSSGRRAFRLFGRHT
jgi:hypothetical protein